MHFALFVSKRKLENSYVPVTILSSVRSIKHMMDSLCKWITNLFINFNSLQSTLDNDYSFSFSGNVEHVANFRADNKAILSKLRSQPCIHFGAVSLIPSSLQETDCEIKLHKVLVLVSFFHIIDSCSLLLIYLCLFLFLEFI